MKILYLGPLWPHEHKMIRAVRDATELGTELQLVTAEPASSRLDQVEQELDLPIINISDERTVLDDWDRAGSYGLRGRMALKQQFRRLMLRLGDEIERLQPDYLWASWLQTYGYLAARCKGELPLQLTLFGTDIFLRPFDNRANRRKSIYTLSRADAINTDSRTAQKTVSELLPSCKAHRELVPYGIDQSRFNARQRVETDGAVRMIMVKRFDPVTRVDRFIDALQAADRTNLEVKIYGFGSLEAELRQQYEAADFDPQRVHWCGRIANDQLSKVLPQQDFFVSCNESEGTSVAMMEAMSCGVIPIVPDLPAYCEWIDSGKTGFIYPSGDIKALSELIEKVAQLSADERRSMRERIIELAEKEFNWTTIAQRLVGLIQSVHHATAATDASLDTAPSH